MQTATKYMIVVARAKERETQMVSKAEVNVNTEKFQSKAALDDD